MSEPRSFDLWIEGDWRPSTGEQRIDIRNPVSGDVVHTIANATEEDVDAAVESASAAGVGVWRTDHQLRSEVLWNMSRLLVERAPQLAELDIEDSGRLPHQAVGQIRNVARWYRYFAGLADKIHGETIPNDSPSMLTFTLREPYGVVAAITAWNAPLLLAGLKLAPALAAGNTIVLKPSELSAASTLELARLFMEAGAPAGVVNVVTGDGVGPGAALVAHPGVSYVTFTGSVAGGRRVAATAAQHLKKVTLELGGKSPNIVFDDADLDAATIGVLAGVLTLAGQSCIAGSRVLVQRGVYEEMLERLGTRVDDMIVGPSDDPTAELGPISNHPQMERVEQLVGAARNEGTRVVSGGGRADRDGLFFLPTIFADVDNDAQIAREEVFGPVMVVIPFDDEADALRIANDSSLGLASGVWTSDLSRAHRMVRGLQAGSVFVNNYRGLGPGVPFGGYKDSGIGRENGIQALLEFTQVKGVWIETAPSTVDPFRRA